MTRIKDRTRRKAALNDRKSAASQARMKNIANLANDDRVPKKKRKGGGEDMFGADDADWAIYRKIVSRPLIPRSSTRVFSYRWRTQQLYLQMKKTILTNSRLLNKNYCNLIPHSQLNTHMLQLVLNVLHSCLPSNLYTRTVTSVAMHAFISQQNVGGSARRGFHLIWLESTPLV